jgi:hypothetical protein
LKKSQWILGVVVLAAMVALVMWGRTRIHFDFANFRSQLALAQWSRIGIAAACIYLGYAFRSVRWALLLRHNKKVPVFSLLGTQVMGFTGVALIGRVADLIRPYLVSQKTGLELSSQIAVYIVERLFDAGSMALIASVAIMQLPDSDVVAAINYSKHLAALSQSHPDAAQFLFRFGGLLLTFAGALFLVFIRLSGGVIASVFEHTFGLVSRKLGHAVGHKIRTFRTGLDTIRSFSDFATTASLSIAMWALIAAAYFETMRAFVASPQLAVISPAKCVLLMVVSGGASIIQLPVLGWFSQIGIVAAAISGFFAVAPEAALACAATLLLVTFLSIVPVGLIWSQIEHVSLRHVAEESEHASEEISSDPAPGSGLD